MEVASSCRPIMFPYQIILDKEGRSLLGNWKNQIDETADGIRRTLDTPNNSPLDPKYQRKMKRVLGKSPREEDIVLLSISRFVFEKMRGTVLDYTNSLYRTALKATAKAFMGGNFSLLDIHNRNTLCTCIDKAATFDVIARETYEINGRIKRIDGFLNLHHYWKEDEQGAVFDNYYGKHRFGYFTDPESHAVAVENGRHYLAVVYDDMERKWERVKEFFR